MRSRREPTFDEWFARTYDRTVAMLVRLVGEPAAAEDLAAEAFARALVKWRRLEAADHRDAWLIRVATNLGIDQLRRKPPPDPPRGTTDGPAEVVALRVALRQALGRLPRRQREALALRYLVGLSPMEVATTLDLSLGTVKTHLRRGLRALRADPRLTMEETPDVIGAD
jgi:RNA polymerase sigma-70 factor (sigma-E family)